MAQHNGELPVEMQELFDLNALDRSKLLACSRIIIDGDPSAGKSTAARTIANELGFRVISFDSYLPGDRRLYLEQLNYETLQNDILVSAERTIIEGVCALKILARIHVNYDCHIFKKLFLNGRWSFEDYAGDGSELPKDQFKREIAEYYREYKPHEVCNYVIPFWVSWG